MGFRKTINTAEEARQLLKTVHYSSNPDDYNWVIGEVLRASIEWASDYKSIEEYRQYTTAEMQEDLNWRLLIEDLQNGKLHPQTAGRHLTPEESEAYMKQLQMKSIVVERDVF